MDTYRTRRVFVPGGQPQLTYVSRDDHGLERENKAASDNLCKLVTIRGPTKCGKSVLTRRIYPPSTAVWIDGGSVSTEDDLWSQVVEQLGASTSSTMITERNVTATGQLELGLEGSAIFGKATAKATGSRARSSKAATSTGREATTRATALQALQASQRALIIDDFHYLEPELQGSVVRAVKAIVFDGHAVLLLAIPHRRYDSIRVEREMTGRVQQIRIPDWSREELETIPQLGLPLLNATTDDAIVQVFVSESLGSPHLVQELFRDLCIKSGLEETAKTTAKLSPPDTVQALLRGVANDLSRPVFEALARGPRERTKRLARPFRDGRTGDIYLAVLNALAVIKPGVGPIDYTAMRDALNDLLERSPEAHEVSRVLDHMATIQADQEASAPVLDWDKTSRRLHVTDPYFAFFLRWGADVFFKSAV